MRSATKRHLESPEPPGCPGAHTSLGSRELKPARGAAAWLQRPTCARRLSGQEQLLVAPPGQRTGGQASPGQSGHGGPQRLVSREGPDWSENPRGSTASAQARAPGHPLLEASSHTELHRGLGFHSLCGSASEWSWAPRSSSEVSSRRMWLSNQTAQTPTAEATRHKHRGYRQRRDSPRAITAKQRTQPRSENGIRASSWHLGGGGLLRDELNISFPAPGCQKWQTRTPYFL